MNTIRCCISCILPCGALDVIRIVHANGRVEEISGSVRASEIMKFYPKHVLKEPSLSAEGVCPKIVVVPPDAELQRGKIYFLMPLPPAPEKSRPRTSGRGKKRESRDNSNSTGSTAKGGGSNHSAKDILITDRYLTEILSEKVSSPRDPRRGRVGVWRPHLESISETPSEV